MSDTSSTERDWRAMVYETEGERQRERPIAYEFNNGKRVFKSPEESGGVYYAEPAA